MYYFSKRSDFFVSTCHPDLQILLYEAIKVIDFSVIDGARDEESQNAKFRDGLSKVKYPNSRHNTVPSMAVDIAPYPINFDNRERFLVFGATIMQIARQLYEEGKMTHRLRWGADWKDELKNKDVKASWDPGHLELIVPRGT